MSLCWRPTRPPSAPLPASCESQRLRIVFALFPGLGGSHFDPEITASSQPACQAQHAREPHLKNIVHFHFAVDAASCLEHASPTSADHPHRFPCEGELPLQTKSEKENGKTWPLPRFTKDLPKEKHCDEKPFAGCHCPALARQASSTDVAAAKSKATSVTHPRHTPKQPELEEHPTISEQFATQPQKQKPTVAKTIFEMTKNVQR